MAADGAPRDMDVHSGLFARGGAVLCVGAVVGGEVVAGGAWGVGGEGREDFCG